MGFVEGAKRIIGIADDQRRARLGRLRLGERKREEQRDQTKTNRYETHRGDSTANREADFKGWVAARLSRRKRLKVEDEALGVLDGFLDAHEEGHGLFAVDQPVVVGEREIHHRPRHDLAVAHHGALLGTVHAENA